MSLKQKWHDFSGKWILVGCFWKSGIQFPKPVSGDVSLGPFMFVNHGSHDTLHVWTSYLQIAQGKKPRLGELKRRQVL